ncbi:MAG: COX15/CtaA family protein [Robiginitalea sp.]|uniref:COX15/CtaA family protein n=1 Tax=Robiginitalea sp. TaxID=1902411 RepID=UPI003C719A12
MKRIKHWYRPLAKTSLILVYLVILAGAVVRMTGSGMGCPDWPRCFGYLIPPTEESELLWTPGKTYTEGQVIIRDEALLVAQSKFTSTSDFSPDNWAPYTRHDYAVFNATHTWIEYINRLLGALAGLAMLLLALMSVGWWKTHKSRVIVSWLGVLAIGFQAWLGATVVYSVLEPVKITLHMFMALVIVGMLLWMVHSSDTQTHKYRYDRTTFRLWWVVIPLSMLQILMGTQVRQYIDQQAKVMGLEARAFWLQNPEVIFYVHRSFSVLLLLLHLWAAYRVYSMHLGFNKILASLLVLLGLIFTGIAMNYFAFPWGSQATHLFLAAVLFGFQWYAFMELKSASQTGISS